MEKLSHHLVFSGEEEDFAYWSEVFEGYMHRKKLRKELIGEEESTAEQKYDIWAELIQFLDKRSVMMLTSECRGDGPAAWTLLKSRFANDGTPRRMALLQQLTILVLKENEEMMDYLVRAESLTNSLKTAGEEISDSLLISVVLKGLPKAFDYFKTVHDFSKDKSTFADVKKSLKAFSDSIKVSSSEGSPVSLLSSSHSKPKSNSRFNGTCFKCNKSGHKASSCRVAVKCSYCGKPGRSESRCFKKERESKAKVSSNFAEEFCFVVSFEGFSNSEFVLDSGSTSHMIKDRSLFTSFQVCKDKCLSANSSSSPIEGKGTVEFFLKNSSGSLCKIKLSDCLFVPGHSRNLLSVGSFLDKGVRCSFEKCELTCPNGVKFPFSRQKGLFVIDQYIAKSFSCEQNSSKLKLWHERLGHFNSQRVVKLSDSVLGIDSLVNCSLDCSVCPLAKQSKTAVSKVPEPRKGSKLELVYSDVLGPVEVGSLGGKRFAVSFIDSFSRYGVVYFMKHKSEVLEKFQLFCKNRGLPKCLRSDNGKEYSNYEFVKFCTTKNIKHEFSTPYCPNQNGVAERRWRTCVEMSRCLLRNANLPKSLWVRALDVAFYLSNRCLVSSLPNGKTPFDFFHGSKPDLSNLKVFGCVAFRKVETHSKKFDDRSKQELFIGYSNIPKSYYLLTQSLIEFICLEMSLS